MSADNKDKFLSLYKPVHERFERFCRSRVYGDLEYKDLMNESLLIAYEKMDSLRSEQAFLSFLFSISIRVLANHNRKRKTERIELNTNARDVLVECKAEQDIDIQILYRLLQQLPQDQQDCLLLFEISGFSMKEIADIQQCTEGSVKQRLRRARIKLSELLNEPVSMKSQL